MVHGHGSNTIWHGSAAVSSSVLPRFYGKKNYKKRLFGLPEVSLYHIAEEARAVLGVFGGIEDIDTDYCSR